MLCLTSTICRLRESGLLAWFWTHFNLFFVLFSLFCSLHFSCLVMFPFVLFFFHCLCSSYVLSLFVSRLFLLFLSCFVLLFCVISRSFFELYIRSFSLFCFSYCSPLLYHYIFLVCYVFVLVSFLFLC